MKQKNMFLVFSVSLAMLLAAGSVQALTIRRGNDVTVPKGEAINETLFAAGQTVTIDADVNGDVICAGQSITVNGNVAGDVLCAGQTVTVSGVVSGSVRAMGQSVQVKGGVGRNVTVAGQTVSTEAPVAGEVLFAAQSAILGGQIAKNVAGAANSITVSGSIGGNAEFKNQSLAIQKDASIAGSLVYTSANPAVMDTGAKIAGSITRNEPPQMPAGIKLPEKTSQDIFLEKAGDLLFNLALALILVFFFNKFVLKSVTAMLAKPARSLGWGLLVLVVVPIISVAVMFTIIGIPVGLLGILLFAVAIFFTRILAAIAIGRKFAQTYMKNRPDSLYVQTVVGVVASWIIFAIPVIGWLFSALAVLWGMGGVYYLFKKSPAA
ncbi:MAG: hypothetical protein MUD10_01380 [Candidatus Pacebacteria bacterium]|jgi:membrane protease YdiL (CAAX protease family)|nr:hypothetical protein [Candidatus Paceibacterota bacterium]